MNREKLKILLINTLYSPNLIGGAERVVQTLAEEVTKEGHQTVVVSMEDMRGVRSRWINGVRVYYVGIRNLYWPFRESGNPAILKPFWHTLDVYNPMMADQVGRILDDERPDLVHTHNLSGFSTLCWRTAKKRRLPLVHTLHDYYLLCPKATMFRNGRNCEKQCARCLPYSLPRKRGSNQVDIVTGVSEYILERHLRAGFFSRATKKTVVYNGVEAESSAKLRNVAPSSVRFGYLGRLDLTKGIESFLESVGTLPSGDWSVILGGKGPVEYTKRLRGRYDTGSVSFLGYVTPASFFDRIDVLVVPSLWHEPSGTVISEAYVHGVPIIGSRRGGIPELVEEGRTGLLFDPDRRGDLTEKLQQVLDDPTVINRMKAASQEKAESLLSKNTTARYLGLYADAVGGR